MKTIKNNAASIRQRLLNHARAERMDFERILVRYAIERMLYRLSLHGQGNRFLLKGAMLFLTWPVATPRPTGDLDLLGYGSPARDRIAALFSEVCKINDENDGLTFDADSVGVEALREDEEYEGVRLLIDAKLGTAKIKLKIDVGFGDHVHPAPREIEFPCLLSDLAAPRILAYPQETVIAEKFEAMVRYAEATSRLKDFHDIRTISQSFDIEKAVLAEAIAGTLRRRHTAFPETTPYALTPAFAQDQNKNRMWEAFLRRSAPAGTEISLAVVIDDLRRFLEPVYIHLGFPERAHGIWRPKSGWSE